MVWTPYTNSNGQYLASKILQGFFGAPIESLVEVSVRNLMGFRVNFADPLNLGRRCLFPA